VNLPVVRRGLDDEGRAERVGRDLSGALVQYSVDAWGRPRDARVVSPAPGL